MCDELINYFELYVINLILAEVINADVFVDLLESSDYLTLLMVKLPIVNKKKK